MVANLSLEVLGGETIPLKSTLDRQVAKLALGSEIVECSPVRQNENRAIWGGRSEFVFSPITTSALSVQTHSCPNCFLLKTFLEEASLAEKIRVTPEDITESGRTAFYLT